MASRLPSAGARGIFVTGTDTGVGKTRIACALLRAYAGSGRRAVGMKPVAAGARHGLTGLSNDDVDLLRAASSVSAPRELVNPYCFEPAIAPHLAATEAGIVVELPQIVDAYFGLSALAEHVVVEGAGGFLVPIGRALSMADIAGALALPIVLVVGMRLGCLNHALLTCESIQRRGLRLAGWVANCFDPGMQRLEHNIAALRERIAAPLLGVAPYDPEPGATLALDAAVLGLPGAEG
ncbi:MAG: dethiobiotin synthase [Burkholderiales bacterium]